MRLQVLGYDSRIPLTAAWPRGEVDRRVGVESPVGVEVLHFLRRLDIQAGILYLFQVDFDRIHHRGSWAGELLSVANGSKK